MQEELRQQDTGSDGPGLAQWLRVGIRRHKPRLLSGTAGISLVSLLATSAVAGAITTDGATLTAFTQLLSNLGANALANWLANWSERKAAAFLRGSEYDSESMIDAMSADLEESLRTDNALSNDVAGIFRQMDAIRIAIAELQDEGEQQTALLRRLSTDIPSFSGQLAEYLSAEIRIASESLASRLATAQRVNPPFVTAAEFFGPLLDKADLFNHTWALVGRDNTLKDLHSFVEGRELDVAVLKGRGGIGKSRILHEFSVEFPVRHPSFELLFVLENADLSKLDITDLPAKPCVIIVDDAHRRDDLETLITLARRRTTPTKLIFSIRPQGEDRLRVLLGHGHFDRRRVSWMRELKALDRSEVKLLAEQVLAGPYSQFSDELAALTRDCPLLTVIGGRLLMEQSVPPALLERHEEFREVILQKFYDEILGRVNEQIDPKECQSLLRLISGVAPFPTEDEGAVQTAVEFLQIDKTKLIIYLGILERAGIVLARGSLVRIVPDVLSDYVLYEACFTHRLTTGYAQKLYNAFFTVCPTQVLRNLAELDWRVKQQSSSAGLDLLRDLWEHIRNDFTGSSTVGRVRWLGVMREAAFYQPRQVLELVEIALRDALAASHPDDGSPGNEAERIFEAVPGLLHWIAYSPEFTSRCFDWLWVLGRNKNLALHSTPEHPIRQLAEFANYGPETPLWMIDVLLDCASGWLLDAQLDEYVYHPLDVIKSLFAKSGHSDYSDGATITSNVFFVIRENTQVQRQRALELTLRCAKSERLRPAIRAIHVLSSALREPVGWFGMDVPDEECLKWEPDDLEIIAHLRRLMASDEHPLIHLEIVVALQWHSRRSRSTAVREAASEVLKQLPTSFQLRLMRVLFYLHDHIGSDLDEEDADPYSAALKKRNEECVAVAEELVTLYPDATDGLRLLDQCLRDAAEMRSADRQIDYSYKPQHFMHQLALSQPAYTIGLCNQLILNPDSYVTYYFGVFVAVLRFSDFDATEKLANHALDSGNLLAVRAVARSYDWMPGSPDLLEKSFPTIARLIEHTDASIRRGGLASLAALGQSELRKALDIIQSVDIGTDAVLAQTLCEVVSAFASAQDDAVTDEDLKQLLKKLWSVTDISDHDVNQFLILASRRVPDDVVDLLVWRAEHSDNVQDSSFTALPYIGFHESLEGLRQSARYPEYLRRVRDLTLAQTSRYNFSLLELYGELSFNYDNVGLDVLREWFGSKEELKLQTVGRLVSYAPPNFVFKEEDFAAALLNAAHAKGEECLETISGNLYHSSVGGGRPFIAEHPFARDSQQLDSAKLCLKRYRVGTPAYRFYNMLFQSAERRLAQYMKRKEHIRSDNL